ncbi:hypothetical protein [Streptomyces sp. NPDC047061]|uniref:hypothetical protein n=1 Tax=Streptomyces sp. NPDC047061 TaxID=3154605 RepID=UPI0033E831EA
MQTVRTPGAGGQRVGESHGRVAGERMPRLIAAERAVCEHAFAHLKNRRVLTRPRLDVQWATRLVRPLMVVDWHEIAR